MTTNDTDCDRCILCGEPVEVFTSQHGENPPAGYTGIHDRQTKPVHPECAAREAE